MVDLIEEAFRFQTFLESHQVEFCFIGGVAVQHWGEPRLTRDIDISLLTGFGGEERFVDLLLGAYRQRIEDARRFALSRRVLLLLSQESIGIDVSLAALSYEELAIRRAILVELLPHRSLRLCAPEDLVIMKLFAGPRNRSSGRPVGPGPARTGPLGLELHRNPACGIRGLERRPASHRSITPDAGLDSIAGSAGADSCPVSQ